MTKLNATERAQVRREEEAMKYFMLKDVETKILKERLQACLNSIIEQTPFEKMSNGLISRRKMEVKIINKILKERSME